MPPPVLPPLTPPTGPGIVDGTDGADTIDDTFIDAEGDRITDLGVSVLGGDGRDEIHDGLGDDQLWGGDGNDELYSGWIFGEVPNGNDTLIGGAGNDYLVGSGGADLLIGDDPNSINGPGGDDDFMLLDGDITAIGGGGEDSFTINNRVGAPSDRTLPISGNQVVYGGEDGGLGLAESEDRLSVGWHTPESDPIASLLTITGNEQGILNYNGRTVEFHEIERVDLYDGDDRVVVEKGSTMTVFGGRGDDTLVLPEPVDGDPATQYEIEAGKFSGTVTFGDGTVLRYVEFEHIICFAAGTLIDTDQGPKPVETLHLGDRVLTRDAGFQPLVWTGSRDLSARDLAQCPKAAPIRISAGALGPNVPATDLTVSPRHRMVIEGIAADLMFGTREVLVAAADLIALPGISRVVDQAVRYVHVMCENHQILRAQGAWSESFQPSVSVLNALDAATRAELLALFPDLARRDQPPARPVLSGAEARELLGLSHSV